VLPGPLTLLSIQAREPTNSALSIEFAGKETKPMTAFNPREAVQLVAALRGGSDG
jgi:hypothetical protein